MTDKMAYSTKTNRKAKELYSLALNMDVMLSFSDPNLVLHPFEAALCYPEDFHAILSLHQFYLYITCKGDSEARYKGKTLRQHDEFRDLFRDSDFDVTEIEIIQCKSFHFTQLVHDGSNYVFKEVDLPPSLGLEDAINIGLHSLFS